jgi:pre-rRNA-processing protein TSR1
MQEDSNVLDMPDPEEQDDLVSENEPDFMENEQTWPTEEELAEAEGTDFENAVLCQI